MTVASLKSSFTSEFLAIESMKRYGDGSGYKLDLELQSGPFAARYPLFVEEHPFQTFLASLSSLYQSLSGEATLGPEHEPQFILVKGGTGGQMFVSGELIEHSGHSQLLKFHFRTDQTCVGQFLEQLKHELGELAF
jgi:hypothetical protein